MGVSAEYREFISEQLEGFGPVTVKRMFGGAGVFREGLMFGLISDELLYFKVDDATRPDFEAEGTSPFTYQKNGKAMALAYWRIPERLYDDADELTEWAHRAFAVALRADARKPQRQRKRVKPA